MAVEVLQGQLRAPKQMLADQEYGGHALIHDDDMAEKLGFAAPSPIGFGH